MAARPCPIRLTGCPGVDSPISNTSAESVDPLLFAAVIWPNWDNYAPPVLGDGPRIQTDCAAIGSQLFSNIDPVIYAHTQALANLLALGQELGCQWEPPDHGNQTYTNEEQCATEYCANGSSFTACVPAGTMTSGLLPPDLGAQWVLIANAWAQAQAALLASQELDCIGPEDPPETPGRNPPTVPLGPGINDRPSWMCFGEEYFNRYAVTGRGAAAYTFSVTAGSLPPGTTFVQEGPRSAVVSGTPTVPGVYTYTITAVSTTVPTFTVSVQDTVFVMGISNYASLPDATEGTPYSEVLLAVGGTSPYTYALDVGSSLPTGLSLAADGTISGTASVTGDFTFDVVFTDATGGHCTQTVLFTVAPATCSFVCAGPTLIPLSSTPTPFAYVPTGSVFVPSTGMIYAGASRFDGANTVSVIQTINPTTNLIVAENVISGQSCAALHYDPSTDRLYCTVALLSGVSWGVSVVSLPGLAEINTTLLTNQQGLRSSIDLVNRNLYIGTQDNPSLTFRFYSFDLDSFALTTINTGGGVGDAFNAYDPTDDLIFIIWNGNIDMYNGVDLSFAGTIDYANNFSRLAFDSTNSVLHAIYDTGATNQDIFFQLDVFVLGLTTNNFTVPLVVGGTVNVDVVDHNGWRVGQTVVTWGGTDQWTISAMVSPTTVTLQLVAFGALVPGGNVPAGTQLLVLNPIVQTVAGPVLGVNTNEIFWNDTIARIIYLDTVAGSFKTFNPATSLVDCTIATYLNFAYTLGASSVCKLYVPVYDTTFPETDNGIKVFG